MLTCRADGNISAEATTQPGNICPEAMRTPSMALMRSKSASPHLSTFLNFKVNEHFWGTRGGLRGAFVENRQNLDPITVVTSVKRALTMVPVRAPHKTLQSR
jgi:hypothetical protein